MPTVIDAATGALSPVVTSVQRLPVADDIAEVTVTGQRIPWYAWFGAGVVVGVSLAWLLKR